MWQTLAPLTEIWDSWSVDKELNGQRVRDVERRFREEAIRQHPHVSADQWEIFFGLLLWREMGEAAPLMRTLGNRSPTLGFKPPLSLTHFLIQRRPRGEPQRLIRAEAIAQTRPWWAFWRAKSAYFELAHADDHHRWTQVPLLDWLFKGSFWRCPPMQGEAVLLDLCHRLFLPTMEA